MKKILNNKLSKHSLLHLYLPSIGICLYFILYFIAAKLYSGGSQKDLTSTNFDWIHNYWCDLLGVEGLNGLPNPAYPFGIGATFILALSIAIFGYQLPIYLTTTPLWRKITQYSAISSMCLGIWIFTPFHDLVIIFTSLLGLLAVIGIFKILIQHQLSTQLWAASFCFFLILINNILYYGSFLEWLPLIQKISFLIILIWLMNLNVTYAKMSTNKNKKSKPIN